LVNNRRALGTCSSENSNNLVHCGSPLYVGY
jgi:hypothetical protein